MTFRTETSSSTTNTRRDRECATGIGSVAKGHPASVGLYTSVKTGTFLFSRARCAWRDVIQAATVVNYFGLQKSVLMHERDHRAQDLVARKSSKLNWLVVVVPTLEILRSNIVPATDSVPQWNKKPSSGVSFRFGRSPGAMQHFLTFAERWIGLLRYAARFSPFCHRISADIWPRKKAVYRDASDAAGRPRGHPDP